MHVTWVEGTMWLVVAQVGGNALSPCLLCLIQHPVPPNIISRLPTLLETTTCAFQLRLSHIFPYSYLQQVQQHYQLQIATRVNRHYPAFILRKGMH